jgi:hypothetical protein
MLLLLLNQPLALESNPRFIYDDTQKLFPTKRPIEKVVVTVDFTKYLRTNETITSAYWEVTVVSGNDSDAANMIYGGSVIQGNTVLQLITGGLDTVRYAPYCIVTTSDFQVLTLPLINTGQIQVTK